MLGCKFSLNKFSLLIDHPRKLRKLYIPQKFPCIGFAFEDLILVEDRLSAETAKFTYLKISMSRARYKKLIFYYLKAKNQKFVGHFFKRNTLHCFPIENVWEIWLSKIDIGCPKADIGQKMASDQLLFLALQVK